MRLELAQIFVPHENDSLMSYQLSYWATYLQKENFMSFEAKHHITVFYGDFHHVVRKNVKQQLKSHNFHRFGLIRDLGLIQYAFLMK